MFNFSPINSNKTLLWQASLGTHVENYILFRNVVKLYKPKLKRVKGKPCSHFLKLNNTLGKGCKQKSEGLKSINPLNQTKANWENWMLFG